MTGCQSINALLSTQQEKDLVAYINKLTLRGTPPTNRMVKQFVYDIGKTKPRKNWSNRFGDRHSNELECGFLEGADSSRKKAENHLGLSRYFELVCSLVLFLI